MDNKQIWNEKWRNLGKYSQNSAGNRWAFSLIKKLAGKIEEELNFIVDIGCGTGNKTAVLAQQFPQARVKGIDFSTEGIEIAKLFYNEQSNLDFDCLDLNSFASEKLNGANVVDMITAFEVLEHLEDWETLLGQMCKITQKYIMISVPVGRMRRYERGLGHYRNFQKGDIEQFLYSKGFEKIEVYYAGFPFWSPITRDLMNLFGGKGGEQYDMILKGVGRLVHVILRFYVSTL